MQHRRNCYVRGFLPVPFSVALCLCREYFKCGSKLQNRRKLPAVDFQLSTVNFLYSVLSARIGSIVAARQAGTTQAATATSSNSNAEASSVPVFVQRFPTCGPVLAELL